MCMCIKSPSFILERIVSAVYLQGLFRPVVFVMLHQRQPMLLFVLSVALALCSSSGAVQDGNTRQLNPRNIPCDSCCLVSFSPCITCRFQQFNSDIKILLYIANIFAIYADLMFVCLITQSFVNSQTLLSSLTK